MSMFSLDERTSAQKALQTVVAGRQAENLLDFDDPSSDQAPNGLGGLAATEVIPAAASDMLATSSNPLDDLVSIFGGSGPEPGLSLNGRDGRGGMDGLGGLDFGASPPQPSTAATTLTSPAQPQKPQEDLLGLF